MSNVFSGETLNFLSSIIPTSWEAKRNETKRETRRRRRIYSLQNETPPRLFGAPWSSVFVRHARAAVEVSSAINLEWGPPRAVVELRTQEYIKKVRKVWGDVDDGREEEDVGLSRGERRRAESSGLFRTPTRLDRDGLLTNGHLWNQSTTLEFEV